MNALQGLQSYTMPMTSYAALSETQNAELQNLLSNYDSKNVSTSDAKQIVSAVKELGITPGNALESAMSSAGFDAREIGKKGEAEGKRPPPPPQGQGEGGPKGEINREAISALTLLLETFEGDDLTDDDWTNFLTHLEDTGIDMSKPLLDIQA